MNAPNRIALPHAIGAAIEGGFFVGLIQLPAGVFGLVKAPRAVGDFGPAKWDDWQTDVPGALSFADGQANTLAMADAGSKLARRILDLKIGEHQDWYLPALDELELAYRSAKPTANHNSRYMRSGINMHAVPPTGPYMSDTDPAQTTVEIFRKGGAEAFSTDNSYWTSTQAAVDPSDAWGQWFDDGGQDHWYKGNKIRACLVRRIPIC